MINPELIKFYEVWIKPDIFSLFSGEYIDDIYSTFKLGLWLFLGVLAGLGVYVGLMKLFG